MSSVNDGLKAASCSRYFNNIPINLQPTLICLPGAFETNDPFEPHLSLVQEIIQASKLRSEMLKHSVVDQVPQCNEKFENCIKTYSKYQTTEESKQMVDENVQEFHSNRSDVSDSSECSFKTALAFLNDKDGFDENGTFIENKPYSYKPYVQLEKDVISMEENNLELTNIVKSDMPLSDENEKILKDKQFELRHTNETVGLFQLPSGSQTFENSSKNDSAIQHKNIDPIFSFLLDSDHNYQIENLKNLRKRVRSSNSDRSTKRLKAQRANVEDEFEKNKTEGKLISFKTPYRVNSSPFSDISKSENQSLFKDDDDQLFCDSLEMFEDEFDASKEISKLYKTNDVDMNYKNSNEMNNYRAINTATENLENRKNLLNETNNTNKIDSEMIFETHNHGVFTFNMNFSTSENKSLKLGEKEIKRDSDVLHINKLDEKIHNRTSKLEERRKIFNNSELTNNNMFLVQRCSFPPNSFDSINSKNSSDKTHLKESTVGFSETNIVNKTTPVNRFKHKNVFTENLFSAYNNNKTDFTASCSNFVNLASKNIFSSEQNALQLVVSTPRVQCDNSCNAVSTYTQTEIANVDENKNFSNNSIQKFHNPMNCNEITNNNKNNISNNKNKLFAQFIEFLNNKKKSANVKQAETGTKQKSSQIIQKLNAINNLDGSDIGPFNNFENIDIKSTQSSKSDNTFAVDNSESYLSIESVEKLDEYGKNGEQGNSKYDKVADFVNEWMKTAMDPMVYENSICDSMEGKLKPIGNSSNLKAVKKTLSARKNVYKDKTCVNKAKRTIKITNSLNYCFPKVPQPLIMARPRRLVLETETTQTAFNRNKNFNYMCERTKDTANRSQCAPLNSKNQTILIKPPTNIKTIGLTKSKGRPRKLETVEVNQGASTSRGKIKSSHKRNSKRTAQTKVFTCCNNRKLKLPPPRREATVNALIKIRNIFSKAK